MNRFYFLAVILVLGVLAISMVFAAARIAIFLDIPTLIILTVPSLALCLATFPPRDIGRSFAAAFTRHASTEAELRTAAVFFRSLERYILLSGFIGALIGIITILTVAELSNTEGVATGFALLLLSVFYALVLMLALAVPFRAAVDRKLAGIDRPSRA